MDARPLSRMCFCCIQAAVVLGVLFIWSSINPTTMNTAFPGVPWAHADRDSIAIRATLSPACQKSPTQGNIQELEGKRGYVLAFRYWEQQTQATKSLLQLQCFASSHGLQVVEPFVHQSSFSVHFDQLSREPPLRFSDLVDVDFWNRRTRELGFGKLATWDDFILLAPRDIVTACIRYRDPDHLKKTVAGSDFRTSCSRECMVDSFNASITYLQQYGFRSVRNTCTDFVHFAGAVSAEDFVGNILGSHRPGEVTVMMNEFRGFFGLYRAEVLTQCGLQHFDTPVLPSASIVSAAGRYIRNQFDDRPYIAILVRIERIVYHLHQSVHVCMQEMSNTMHELGSAFNVSRHFLGMDVGRFGSSGAKVDEMVEYGKRFVQVVYGDQWSFDQWEASFENSSLYSSPAYVATFQRTIASNARCLVLVGGGGFQLQAKSLYLKHQLGNDLCIRTICSTHLLPTPIHTLSK